MATHSELAKTLETLPCPAHEDGDPKMIFYVCPLDCNAIVTAIRDDKIVSWQSWRVYV